MPQHPGHFAIDGAAWFAVLVGVANKVNPRPRMVRADSASRQNTRPDLVTHRLHVSA
jgi:hypothetical protein